MKKRITIIAFALAVVMLVACLCACVPTSLEKAQSKMKDAGYTVSSYKTSSKDSGVVGGFIATKISLEDGSGILTAVLYNSADEAKNAMGDKEKEKKEDQVIKQSGKWIYWGSPKAVETFEK